MPAREHREHEIKLRKAVAAGAGGGPSGDLAEREPVFLKVRWRKRGGWPF